jgi:uncharacterized protein YndB with AHSA1/START domain
VAQTKVTIARKLSVPTDRAWEAIRAIGRLDVWFPTIGSCRVEGAGVGAHRYLTLKRGGDITDRVLEIDPARRRLTYQRVKSPFPVTSYRGTVEVFDSFDAHAVVVWTVDFESEPADSTNVSEMLKAGIGAGVEGMEQDLQRAAGTVLPDLGVRVRPLIQALPAAMQPRFLAQLERAAADRYDAWAAACPDAARAEGLRACARREREVAQRAEAVFASQPDEQRHFRAALPGVAQEFDAAMANRPLDEQYAIQAAAERRGAAFWRAWAASLPDARAREALASCAALEEQSAEFLDTLITLGTRP